MKRGTIYLVDVVTKDGTLVYYFEDKQESKDFEIKANHFSSNVKWSCWTYETPKHAVA